MFMEIINHFSLMNNNLIIKLIIRPDFPLWDFDYGGVRHGGKCFVDFGGSLFREAHQRRVAVDVFPRSFSVCNCRRIVGNGGIFRGLLA